MNRYDRIVVLAQPELQPAPALPHAVRLAARHGAALHLIAVDRLATPEAIAQLHGDDIEPLREASLRRRRTWLTAQIDKLRAQGLRVTGDAPWAVPIVADVLAQARACHADLIVKDAEPLPGLAQTLTSPLDWQLMRESPLPVLRVHDTRTARRRLVVAVDIAREAAMPLNDKLMREAQRVAGFDAAALELVQVFDVIAPPAAAAAPLQAAAMVEAMREAHEARFAAFAERHGVPAAQRHFLVGPAATVVADLAVRGAAELLVIGSTYRPRGARIVIGSTAARLLDEAPCSVLLVKSDAQAAALEARISAPVPAPNGGAAWTQAA